MAPEISPIRFMLTAADCYNYSIIEKKSQFVISNTKPATVNLIIYTYTVYLKSSRTF